MNEKFLHYLWKFQLFNLPLLSTDFEEVVIKKAGKENQDAGPDFLNALVKIGNTLWSGHVEIHINATDWLKHQHHKDEKYKNIILHVVYNDDRDSTDNKQIIMLPTLEVKYSFNKNLLLKYHSFMSNMNWIACENQIHQIDRFRFYYFMNRLAIERLESKTDEILKVLKENKNNFEKTFYELLAKNFGFNTNANAFENLAKSIPLEALLKHKNSLFQIEALLFGQAGMLDKKYKEEYPKALLKEYQFLQKKFDLTPIKLHQWKFLRLRPSNFPTIRISQFAKLIFLSSGMPSHILEMEDLKSIRELFHIEASEYWDTHFNFRKKNKFAIKKFGHQSTSLILINTIIPYLFIYGKLKAEENKTQRALRFLEAIEGEQNQITRQWKRIGINTTTAFHTQALIHLKKVYCDHKKCLDCQIGHVLLKSTSN